MLELAARRAKCVDQSVSPRVRQLALMDWYTSYELQVRLLPLAPNSQGDGMLAGARTEIHGLIQDVFNEFNVQIMSPNFVLQPDEPVMVPKEKWFTAPAQPPSEG